MSEEKIISQEISHDSLEVIEYVVGDDSMSQGTHITVFAKTVISKCVSDMVQSTRMRAEDSEVRRAHIIKKFSSTLIH